MLMKERLRVLINKAGNTLRVQGQTTSWQAIVQPLRYRNKLYVEETSVPAGMVDRTAYLYIGLPENDLSAYARGTVFVCDGQLLTLSHSEVTFTKDEAQYVWAVFNRYAAEADEEDDE